MKFLAMVIEISKVFLMISDEVSLGHSFSSLSMDFNA